MSQRKNRWIAFLLVFATIMSLLALPALASESGEEQEEQQTISLEDLLTKDPVEEVEPEIPLVNVIELDQDEAAEPAETAEPDTSADPVSPEEEAEDTTASDEPAETDGDTEYTVTYYTGETEISHETVASGGSPASIPTQDASGAAITGWLNEAGSFVVAAKAVITGDTNYYAWYAPALQTTEHNRYIQGKGSGMFYPNYALTRAEAATLLYNLLVDKSAGSYTCTFSDVTSSSWYYTAVTTLASYKVLSGYSDGTFRPNNSISRAEFVTMLVRVYGLQNKTQSFSDVSATHWAVDYIATASANGWVSGYEDGTFQPNQSITRAEAVTVINRVLGRTADRDTITTGDNILHYLDVSESGWYYWAVMEASIGHEYTKTSSGETWTSYNAESCGLTAGLHTINGSQYYVSADTKQFVKMAAGVNEINGSYYYAAAAGYVIDAVLTDGVNTVDGKLMVWNSAKKAFVAVTAGITKVGSGYYYAAGDGYSFDADLSTLSLVTGFNRLGTTLFYWEGSAPKLLTAGLNTINGNTYYADAAGYAIRNDFGAGLVQLGGKYYLSSGACDIITYYYSYTTGSAVKTDLKSSTYEYNKSMYYIQSDYSILIDAWQGYLYFGTDGKYTTGDATLDAYVYNILSGILSNNALTPVEKLLKAYYAIRGGEGTSAGTCQYSYLNTGLGCERARYNGQTQYAWQITCAKYFFSAKRGMCYHWGSAYLYLARRLGFQAYSVVGSVFSNRARHCWCMIKWNNTWHISDVEIEWGYLNRYYSSSSIYWNLFDQAVSSEWISSYTNPECNSIKYYFDSD